MSLKDDLVRALQARLADLGYYRLMVDGLPGQGTSSAIIRFKEAHGLRARDFVGPITLATLFSDRAQAWAPREIEGEPAWLTEARALLGTRETPGSANNPKIMKWATGLDQWYPGDDVPWCGLFVAHCMATGAPDEPQDFNRLGARNWNEYGVAADLMQPPLGAVAVFWRTHPTASWNGHVAIVTGHNDTHVRCIGGNQSDNVTEAWFSRDRLLGMRVPAGYAGTPAPRAETGAVSRSEA